MWYFEGYYLQLSSDFISQNQQDTKDFYYKELADTIMSLSPPIYSLKAWEPGETME